MLFTVIFLSQKSITWALDNWQMQLSLYDPLPLWQQQIQKVAAADIISSDLLLGPCVCTDSEQPSWLQET